MEKSYNPSAIEQRWYQFWEEKAYFEPSADKDADNRERYCIMLPHFQAEPAMSMCAQFWSSIKRERKQPAVSMPADIPPTFSPGSIPRPV